MTVIKSEKELKEMTERAENDIAVGDVFSMKEVYEDLYKNKKTEVGTI